MLDARYVLACMELAMLVPRSLPLFFLMSFGMSYLMRTASLLSFSLIISSRVDAAVAVAKSVKLAAAAAAAVLAFNDPLNSFEEEASLESFLGDYRLCGCCCGGGLSE